MALQPRQAPKLDTAATLVVCSLEDCLFWQHLASAALTVYRENKQRAPLAGAPAHDPVWTTNKEFRKDLRKRVCEAWVKASGYNFILFPYSTDFVVLAYNKVSAMTVAERNALAASIAVGKRKEG